jgi:hypothetical protein
MTFPRARALAGVVATLCVTSLPVLAQRDSTVRIDARWRGYLGCWATTSAAVRGPDVCLVPTADSTTVDLVVLRQDSVMSVTQVTSSGARVNRVVDGCSGWESGRWSADERRLYTHAHYTCPGRAPQVSSGMYAMSARFTFSRIERTEAGGADGVRLVTFSSGIADSVLPDSVARRLPPTDARTLAARGEAAAEVSTADVADAAHAVDAAVVEAWIADRRQQFALTPRDARALRDARVPGRVIDMMVVVSYPERFRLWQNTIADARASGAAPSTAFSGLSSAPASLTSGWLTGPAGAPSALRYFGSPLYDPLNPFSDCFSALSCATGYSVVTPHITFSVAPRVQSSPFEPNMPGRAVNGLGYTQDGGGGGGMAAPSMTGGGYTPGSSSGGSGGGMVGGGTSSGATEQRTAKPRP